ncbi:hypothetical protein JOD43_001419 [Pullulanibacillus pueri]|uniref:Sporulation lipoprotein YhcN/YlaJ n=1 Tax=Pullulanibacillus pueri TaxID=1437324 RepID=A0A8J2ZU99_9BACL|nr:hypothetical protein [Pullulanibacillus pueri]MBM7681252.1 hypothetical protein [Pullulanibacillus pueri]GGH77875.1 hypothetical protein GCM10007096_10420 [Pullulanibacillus pueri]
MKMKGKKVLIVPLLGAATLLSACSAQNPNGASANDSTPDTHLTNVADQGTKDKDLSDSSIIPSETSDKTRTTNKDGSSYKGLGQDIYGSIGSSGIHEGGISSYFESILEGQGITGVKVFVVDDAVVLARAKSENTSSQYSNAQRHLLSNTSGMSGKGEVQGTEGKEVSTDNLDQASKSIRKMFNGNVKILTATDPKVPDLVEKVKADLESSSYEAASRDLLTLLNMTK